MADRQRADPKAREIEVERRSTIFDRIEAGGAYRPAVALDCDVVVVEQATIAQPRGELGDRVWQRRAVGSMRIEASNPAAVEQLLAPPDGSGARRGAAISSCAG